MSDVDSLRIHSELRLRRVVEVKILSGSCRSFLRRTMHVRRIDLDSRSPVVVHLHHFAFVEGQELLFPTLIEIPGGEKETVFDQRFRSVKQVRVIGHVEESLK